MAFKNKKIEKRFLNLLSSDQVCKIEFLILDGFLKLAHIPSDVVYYNIKADEVYRVDNLSFDDYDFVVYFDIDNSDNCVLLDIFQA